MKTIYKPWGREEWLELNDKYCYKRIYINAGYKTSFQYHLKKYETNYLISGTAELWLENDNGEVEKKTIHANDFFNVSPPKKHRIIALTDIILQEVSTPEVDDVIRIEDDTNRQDGKLEEEQKTPVVLILAAGLGTRVRSLAQNKNKALIPINNKAILSHIIEKYPKEYTIVIAVGYQSDSLIEYCRLAHPDRKFIFQESEGWEDPKIGPGMSAKSCEKFLQQPFYIQTADTIIDVPLPYLDGNWVGIAPTGAPEKYSTIQVDDQLNVKSFINKSTAGFENAFMGIAAIRDYKIFWSELNENISNGNTEVISAWFRSEKWPSLKAKELPWFDTGNLDDIQKAKEHFRDKPLSLFKNIDDTTYRIGKRFLKFSSNTQTNENRYQRGLLLGTLIPPNIGKTDHFIYYDWEDGSTLYEQDSLDVYFKFLEFLSKTINVSKFEQKNDLLKPFYIDKTNGRKDMFLTKYGNRYFTSEFVINGIKYPSLQSLLDKVDIKYFDGNPLYSNFHGDLQFDNVIHNQKTGKFSYIDWRESFACEVKSGDIYYDMSKLYGGCLLPYNLLKNDDYIQISEGVSVIDYEYEVPFNLNEFRLLFEQWLVDNDFNLNKVKLIKSLIYLNMSPLHTDKFNKLLWFKSIEGLYECVNK